ncbi:MAG: L,D-transpeptidase [Alphaproteobacteria bacterium]|nr:L,D-transpeptidase [Alphaproteobacteria bacterium]
MATGEATAAVTVTIDLSRQTMTVISGAARSTYEWKVSTARRGYVTPLGSYRPQFLKRMHYSSRYHNSPMPHSIFFKGNFAIHGTNYIKSLGKPASHGCVRLHPTNARLLFNLVRQEGMENTTITIVP